MLQKIIDGRTDLVFDYLAAGNGATTTDDNGVSLIAWCAYHGDSPLAWASWHLRPASVLRLLCYDSFSIHQDNDSSYDHGIGWGQLDSHAMSRPHV